MARAGVQGLHELWAKSVEMFDLTGRVAVVTGGNGGIGLGIAKGFVGAGAKVVIAGRNPEKNAAALAELGAAAIAVRADVTVKADRDAMYAAANEAFGGVDIAVANAGISRGGRPESLPMEAWDEVIAANLTAVFATAREAHPFMKARGGGKVITVGSMYSLFSSGNLTPYSASKGGVVQLTKSLAIAWAQDNIQVNCILPGWIETEMTLPAKTRAPGFNEAIVARTPARRWGMPGDFAGPAVFLASAASDFVTGHSLAVDGGFAVSG